MTRRLQKLRQAMKPLGLAAVLFEPGPAMLYLSGVRWGRSERSFVLIVPLAGEPVFVLPAFEEKRARELIHSAAVRLWQEDQNPFAAIAKVLADRGLTAGRIGLEASARFFVFDGLRQQAPQFDYVSVAPARLGLPLA